MKTLLERLQAIQSEIRRIPQLPEALKDLPVSGGRLAEALDNIEYLSDLNRFDCNGWEHQVYADPEPIELDGEQAEQLLRDLNLHGQVFKQMIGSAEFWYEIGIDCGEEEGTETIATFNSLPELLNWYDGFKKNPNDDVSRWFADQWTEIDGVPTPITTIFNNNREGQQL